MERAFLTHAPTLLCPLPVTHPCIWERCPHAFPEGFSARVFWGDADIKFHVLCPPSALPPVALTPELVSSTADTRLTHSFGEGGQDFSPEPLVTRGVYIRLTAGSSRLQLPLPSWSTRALLSQSPVATSVPSAAAAPAGPAGASARGPGLRWTPVFFLSLFPSSGLIDDHRRPVTLTPRHPWSGITAPRPRRQPPGSVGIPEPTAWSPSPGPPPPPSSTPGRCQAPFPERRRKEGREASERWKGVWRPRDLPFF
ncbi:uncharacterized protein LOC108316950 [Cebus imitator]|uniref:uncharacterized protein LOC108316950 n=1 Tax=Cebus imitator TaxID=2715852 RepID=UPI001899AA4A|nr:uncharacterized protein LOC108316950 [Cebus imitator]